MGPLSVLSVTLMYCGQTVGCMKLPLGMEVGLSPGDICVRWGPSPPLRKRTQQPQLFGPCPLWPNGCMDQDATWYRGRLRLRRHCVRWGPSSPQKGTQLAPTQFLAHVCCGQTAGWIKMPLGTEVGLVPGHIVLYGAQLPQERGTSAPRFSAHVYCGQTVAHLSNC